MEADGEKMQEFVAGAECGVCLKYRIYEIGNYGIVLLRN